MNDLTEAIRYAQGMAVTMRARGRLDDARDWLDMLALLERAQPTDTLREIRSIGARAGTNLHAWNEAFDVIDEALAGKERRLASS